MSIPLYVRDLFMRIYEFHLDSLAISVWGLKQLIYVKLGAPPDSAELAFGREIMSESNQLAQYGVVPGSTITMFFQLTGGGCCAIPTRFGGIWKCDHKFPSRTLPTITLTSRYIPHRIFQSRRSRKSCRSGEAT
jgi:hypothetical protein